MKIFFIIIGILSFLVGVPGFLSSISAVQQTAGILGILVGVVSLGFAYVGSKIEEVKKAVSQQTPGSEIKINSMLK